MIFGEYHTEHQYNRTSSDTLHEALGRMAGAAAAVEICKSCGFVPVAFLKIAGGGGSFTVEA